MSISLGTGRVNSRRMSANRQRFTSIGKDGRPLCANALGASALLLADIALAFTGTPEKALQDRFVVSRMVELLPADCAVKEAFILH